MYENLKSLEKAIAIATDVHANQKDKAGQPYILHPLRVMDKVPTKRLKIIAVLHDVLEDTETIHLDPWDLENYGFSGLVVKAVDCLTRRKGESYMNYIKGRVSTNLLATIVKLADLEDNMDIKRLSKLDQEDFNRLKKYHEAWKYLTDL